MIRALWLTSWYPNRLDAVNGDFIQRHARAASLFCQVDVIHLEPVKNDELKQPLEIFIHKYESLRETIVLYKQSKKPGLIGKFFSILRYTKIFQKQVSAYISINGIPDIVHVHIPLKAGLIALWLKRKYNIPYVVTEHWAIYNTVAEDAYPGRSFLFKNYLKRVLKNASLFMPVSRNLGEAVQRMVTPVPFTAVPNVADTNLFNLECKNKNEPIFSFLHVSTLKHQKNPEGILNAFEKFNKKFTNTRLVVVGEISENFQKYISLLGIPGTNIKLTGLLSYKAVSDIMKQCQTLVMFSRYENQPCVIIEALCCGLPVISTNVGGIPEIINSSNGILVNNEDELGLFHAMIKLYRNFNQYDKPAIAAHAANLFSYEKVGANIVNRYKKIIK